MRLQAIPSHQSHIASLLVPVVHAPLASRWDFTQAVPGVSARSDHVPTNEVRAQW